MNVPETKITRTKRVPYTEMVKRKNNGKWKLKLTEKNEKPPLKCQFPKWSPSTGRAIHGDRKEVQQVEEDLHRAGSENSFEEVAYKRSGACRSSIQDACGASSGKPRVELLQSFPKWPRRPSGSPKLAAFLIHFNTPRTDFDYSSGPTVV